MNTLWANLIIEELIRCGVEYFCISPGSRSTPLVVAAARNQRARTIICYDERAAGFHAVGYARATGKPAAVITTSGTAVANLLPAIVEASNDHLPLVALTADRPPELIAAGANQTIDQPGIFGSYTRFDIDLPCPTLDIPPQFVLTSVDQEVYRSANGPVHINCRYREPLAPQNSKIATDYTADIAAWQNSDKPFTSYKTASILPGEKDIDSLAQTIDSADTGLLIIGKLTGDDSRNACIRLMKKLNWPIYADITSGLRLTHCKINIIRYFDQQLQSDDFNRIARPSVVLHIGRRVTSKRLPQFLDANRPENYTVIKNDPARCDHIGAITDHIQADIPSTVDRLSDLITQRESSEYTSLYDSKADKTDAIIKANIDADNSVTEPFIARQLTEMIGDDTSLFLSSSMPIRDVDLYGISDRNNIVVAANRGVSGIDGVIASAAGFAAAKNSATTLLIGDLAFIHDINSLTLLSRIKEPVVIVVINNRGGGIFHFLPIVESTDVFEDYFAAPHDYNFRGVCETFGIDYYNPTEKAAFADAYNAAVKNAKPAVIEIATDRGLNLKLRRKMKKEILKMLQE
jgi:2-succinyl-5-enolpyruvyl-6-hydroxy-3-cyclohexene-1-carboxylate synthase